MIEGGFPKPDIQKKEKCPVHPLCNEGSCGFWLGQPHDFIPDIIRDTAYDRAVDEANIGLEVLHWVRSHQAAREHIVSLNPAQYRAFKKDDFIGVIELPSYLEKKK